MHKKFSTLLTLATGTALMLGLLFVILCQVLANYNQGDHDHKEYQCRIYYYLNQLY